MNEPFPASPCYCTNLRQAARAVSALYDETLEPLGLRVTQYSLIAHVMRMEPVTFKDLSKATRLERTTLVRNIELLRKRDLITEAPEPAGKAELLCLTEKGRNALDQGFPLWQKAQAAVKALLGPDEAATLKRLLRKLQTATESTETHP